MFICRFVANSIAPFVCSAAKRFGGLVDVFEFVGWLAIMAIAIDKGLSDAYRNCTSIISHNPSPDGRFFGIVKDCWPLSDSKQGLIVNLVRPEEEEKLASTVDSCDPPETAMLAIWTEDTRDRPLLDWLTPNHLEVSVPGNSKIVLFRMRREGILVDLVFEKTDDQKQRRINETSRESDDYDRRVNNMYWMCVY